MIVVNRRGAGDLIVEGARHLGKKTEFLFIKARVRRLLSNIPLQGDQALTCGDGEQGEVLRDEERRDDMDPGYVRGAVQVEVGRATVTF